MKPYRLTSKPIRDIAEVEFNKFIVYEIDQNGTQNRLYGDIGKKYKDRFEIENLKFVRFKPKEELRAKRGIYIKDEIFLYDDIEYKTKDFKFYSQIAHYDIKKGIIKSRSKFKLISKSAEIIGTDLIYYRNKGKISAKNIDAKIFSKK